ncbi:MAG: hypothetical protein FJY75_03595 [Candidatus Eisenbacteria bacterium]|uniref:6-bladed beta-propeller n=1 Tax=Eiseniibacteriota bacterium TaxID=2212470 RepID=A0A937XAJ8_UNCEI|nr:hypothetical protein [Candidatus Eisenbacteria bacterium]
MRAAVRSLLLAALLGACPAAAEAELSVALAASRSAVGADSAAVWAIAVDGAPIAPLAIDVHSSGSVYGIASGRRRLFIARGVGEPGRYAGGEGSGPAGMADGIFARSGLKVFTLDPWEAVVERFDLAGVRELRFDLRARLSDAGEELGGVGGFCLGPSGMLYVLDDRRARLLVFDDRGAFRRVLGEAAGVVLDSPVAIDIDGHGRLHLLEGRGPALVRVDVDSRATRRDLAAASGGGFRPRLLAVDAWGNAFLGERRSGRILVVPVAGEPPWWLADGSQRGAIDDLAFDGAGNLLVVEADPPRVRIVPLVYRPPIPDAGSAIRER